jgi:hypothetical protein
MNNPTLDAYEWRITSSNSLRLIMILLNHPITLGLVHDDQTPMN